MKEYTKLIKRIRNSKLYIKWRQEVYWKFGGLCSNCGSGGDWIQIHHRKEIITILKEHDIKTLEEANNCKELWDIENGDCLCSIHHYEAHE